MVRQKTTPMAHIMNTLKEWLPLLILGITLFLHLLISPGKASDLLQKIPCVAHFYEDIAKPFTTRPYIF